MGASRREFLAGAASLAALPGFGPCQPTDEIAAGFAAPPQSAKPRVWWHWMNGNVTKDGIEKDLSWMSRVGIGGVQNFDANLSTPKVVEQRLVYMSPEWKDAFRHAVAKADALDLEFAVAASPGWSETGGPWVAPRDGMKKLVWSEIIVDGGRRFHGVLPALPSTTGPFQDLLGGGSLTSTPADVARLPTFCADAIVLAYPVASLRARETPQASVNGAAVDAAVLSDGDLHSGVDAPASHATEPGTLQLIYAQPQTIRSARVFVANTGGVGGGGPAVTLESSVDGATWRKIADVPGGNIPTTVSFAPVTARNFRLAFRPPARSAGFDLSAFSIAPGFDMSALLGAIGGAGAPAPPKIAQFELLTEARVNAYEAKAGFSIADDYFALDPDVGPDVDGVHPDSVIDISAHMSVGGVLDWTPPAGRWKVLRLGYSLTGKMNHPASAEATGLEVDKFDAAAVAAYVNTYLDMYRDTLGPDLIGARGLKALLTDSTEVGASNWTPKLLDHFERLRGYDAKPWLPALTGEIIGSRARSDAFLYDFRHTLGDMHASEHYGTVARVAHQRGLIVYGESLEGGRVVLGDDLDMRSFADIPMAAMWTYGRAPRSAYTSDDRGAASVAHLHGAPIVACESLTSVGQPWSYAPRDLQPMIDQIFANGITRPVIHTSVHQPLDHGPGLSLQVVGQFFTRLDTWAEMAKPWVDYISRNSYLLQQGRNVADVLYFYGEDSPIGPQAAASYPHDVPRTSAYDFISANLLNLLSVNNGDLVSHGGARYKLLYLNAKAAQMTLTTLRKLAALAEAGATIVGNAPRSSPSLKDDPAEFAELARRLWSTRATTRVGAGRVIAGQNVEAALRQINVGPDFMHNSDADIQFVHRRVGEGDLYFVTNRTDRLVQTQARFRVTGRAAEFWHADSGTRRPASFRSDGAQTIVPLNLRPFESIFVVFRAPTTQSAVTVEDPVYRQIGSIEGAWNVGFQAGRGAPASTTLTALASLSANPNAGIKYFSGVATYTKSFDLPSTVRAGQELWLDLGQIGDVAEVRVNGHLAGTVWKAPNRLDIGADVRAGRNALDIRVANLWVNRLIGDQQPSAQKISFTTVSTFLPTAPLRPSGLIGPITLWSV